MNIRGI